MDGERFDCWTRAWDERASRRGVAGLAIGALLSLGVTANSSAKRKKKGKKKKKKSPTAGGDSTCVGKNHCGTEGTFAAQCGDHFNTVPCFCYLTLAGEPYCGSGAGAVSPNPENNLCLNGGCVNQGGACVDMTGCTFGPVGCTLPCPNPW